MLKCKKINLVESVYFITCNWIKSASPVHFFFAHSWKNPHWHCGWSAKFGFTVLRYATNEREREKINDEQNVDNDQYNGNDDTDDKSRVNGDVRDHIFDFDPLRILLKRIQSSCVLEPALTSAIFDVINIELTFYFDIYCFYNIVFDIEAWLNDFISSDLSV